MLGEGLRVAIVGFTTVFVALIILQMSVNLMSFFIRMIEKRKKEEK